jgi:hypothetical protein
MTPHEIKHGSPRTTHQWSPMSTNRRLKTSSTETASSPCRPSTNTKLKPRPGATTRSSQESSTKETSYSSGPPGQSHRASWSQNGRVHSSSRRRHPPARTGYQCPPAKTQSTPGTLTISTNFLFNPQGPRALVTNQTILFRHALFSSWGVRFLARRSHVIYLQKPPQKQKLRCNMSKKTASTVFDIRPLRSHRDR